MTFLYEIKHSDCNSNTNSKPKDINICLQDIQNDTNKIVKWSADWNLADWKFMLLATNQMTRYPEAVKEKKLLLKVS